MIPSDLQKCACCSGLWDDLEKGCFCRYGGEPGNCEGPKETYTPAGADISGETESMKQQKGGESLFPTTENNICETKHQRTGHPARNSFRGYEAGKTMACPNYQGGNMATKQLIPCPKCGGKDDDCTYCNGHRQVEMHEDEGLEIFEDISFGEALQLAGNTILRRARLNG